MEAVADAVAALGGTIAIASERGRGTTFTIDLPAPGARARRHSAAG